MSDQCIQKHGFCRNILMCAIWTPLIEIILYIVLQQSELCMFVLEHVGAIFIPNHHLFIWEANPIPND